MRILPIAVTFSALLSIQSFAATTDNLWQGFYAGVNLGVTQHTMDITDDQAASFGSTLKQFANPDISGGLQIGYRRKTTANTFAGVYGLELNSNFTHSRFQNSYGSPFSNYQLSAKNALTSVTMLQMVGGIAADRTLLFLAGGMSWSHLTGTVVSQNGIPFFNGFSVGNVAFCTAVSAGLEYAMTPRISMRVKLDVITPNTYHNHDNVGDRYTMTNSIAQGTLGINYNF